MDAWPGPQSGPSPENEAVIPADGTQPIQTPQPAQPVAPQPEPPKPEPKAKAEAPAIDQDRLRKQIAFMVDNPDAGKAMLDALLKSQERNPLQELDNLKRQLAIEAAGRRYSIPESYNALIDGDTPEAIESKAAAVAQLLQQQAQPAGTPAQQTPVVNQPQAPAPIPPPARPNLDPRKANIADLEAAALAEPIVTQWGETVTKTKSAF